MPKLPKQLQAAPRSTAGGGKVRQRASFGGAATAARAAARQSALCQRSLSARQSASGAIASSSAPAPRSQHASPSLLLAQPSRQSRVSFGGGSAVPALDLCTGDHHVSDQWSAASSSSSSAEDSANMLDVAASDASKLGGPAVKAVLAPAAAPKRSSELDIFECLIDAADKRRMRLVDLFRQHDKRSRGWLDNSEFLALCQSAVPGVTPGQVQYLAAMLDHDCNGRVSFKDLQHLASVHRATGLHIPVKAGLDHADVLKRCAVLIYDKRASVSWLFARFDSRKAQQWTVEDVATLVRKVMRCGNKAEADRLVRTFMSVVDQDGDGLIQEADLQRAMASGDVHLPALDSEWAETGVNGEPGLLATSLAQLDTEHQVLQQVEAAGSQLSLLLQQISSITGGRSRKLDMGSAKAAAQRVDIDSLHQMRADLANELDSCKDFEAALADKLNTERAEFAGVAAGTSKASAQRGAVGGAPEVRKTGATPAQSMIGHTPRAPSLPASPKSAAVWKQRGAATGAPALPGAGTGGKQARDIATPATRSDMRTLGGDAANVANWKPPRTAKSIPELPQDSHLLASTEVRRNYMVSAVAHVDSVAERSRGVASRTGAYPASGPGALSPPKLPWDRRRQKYIQTGGGRETTLVFGRHAALHGGNKRPESAKLPPTVRTGAPASKARPVSAGAVVRQVEQPLVPAQGDVIGVEVVHEHAAKQLPGLAAARTAQGSTAAGADEAVPHSAILHGLRNLNV